MSKPMIVIADTDENYLAALEYKLLLELDDQIQLEIISDREYFEEFFSAPKTAEIVAVGEAFYSRDLHKHSINNLFVLTELSESGSTEDLSVFHIYKYTGLKEIYNELIYRSQDKILKSGRENKETKIIAFYSAIGGSGKTSLGMGLAHCLAQNHRRVLYISTESVQDFVYYLQDKSGMTLDGYKAIKDDFNHIYQNIRHFIRKEEFSYLPPFRQTLDALNLDFSVYEKLILSAKESQEYDFILVDVDAGYSKERTQLLQSADKVLFILLQDAFSVLKTEYIIHNIDFRDREKYMFICNKYEETKKNAYFQSDMQSKFVMNEYVELVKQPLEDVKQLSELNGIQKLAYMFL